MGLDTGGRRNSLFRRKAPQQRLGILESRCLILNLRGRLRIYTYAHLDGIVPVIIKVVGVLFKPPGWLTWGPMCSSATDGRNTVTGRAMYVPMANTKVCQEGTHSFECSAKLPFWLAKSFGNFAVEGTRCTVTRTRV